MIIKTLAGLPVKLTKTTMQTDGIPRFFGLYDYRFNLKDIQPGKELKHTHGVRRNGATFRNRMDSDAFGFETKFETKIDDGLLVIGCQTFGSAETRTLLKAARAARAAAAVAKTKKVTKKKGKRTRTK